jgi:predicted nucleotidyltransferase
MRSCEYPSFHFLSAASLHYVRSGLWAETGKELISNSYHDIVFCMKSPRATMILRIPSSLHQQLKREARSADMSLNKHCRALLSKRERDSSAEEPGISLTQEGSSRRTPLQNLTARVLETWGGDLEGLALFGSFARGRETSHSDIDLLVVLNRKVTLDRDVYSRWQPHKFDGRDVSPLFVRIPGEGERIGGLWFEVALDGIVLFDKNLRLNRFLSHVRDLIVDGRVKRMTTHGHPYWVHSDRVARDSPPVKGS